MPAPAPQTSVPQAEPPAKPQPIVAADTPAPADEAVVLRQALAAATDPNARVLVIDDLAKLGQRAKGALTDLVACTADADGRTRWHAVRAIGLIGEDAVSAMPTLIGLLKDSDPIVATQSAAAIGLIREDDGREEIPEPDAGLYGSAIEPLIASTMHADPRVRRASLRTLRRLSGSPQQLAPLLSKQLADADPSVVMPALHSLADMGDDAVPFLLETLKQPKSRYWAAVALTEIGPEAAPAVGSLAQLAAEGETEERMQALLALAAIGEQAASASPAMLQALNSDDGALRFAAAFALGRVRAKDADESLARAAQDNDPFLAEVASWARARIHPDDKPLVDEAVQRLRKGLRSDRSNERSAAVSGLSDLADTLDEPVQRELAGDFAGLLADEDPDVGMSGGGALIRLGAVAVDTLRERLKDPALRGRTLDVLAAMGPVAKPAVDDMIAALDDADPVIRGDAAMALASIGPAAAAAVPTLVNMLGEGDAAALGAPPAAYALGRIGPAAKPAMEKLRALATSKNEMLATVAIWATLKIAPEDTSLREMAIPRLKNALRAEREMVRLEAAVALGEIGPAAASTIPMLELVAEEDPSRPVRAAAADALAKVKGL